SRPHLTDPLRRTMTPAPQHIAVVLVRPREEGNVGSVARAMANMGLGELILVEPAAELGGVARGFGVGAWSVLDGARRSPSLADALADVEIAVGTSSGRKRPLKKHSVVDARGLAEAIAPARRVALVFGPEDNGLQRDEIDQCDLLVRIPCAARHPTLNLAQAVLLIAYELHMDRLGRAQPTPAAEPAESLDATLVGERRALIEEARPVVAQLGFDHEHLRESVVRDLRELLRWARPDRRQLGVLRRLLDRVSQRLPTGRQDDSFTNQR
ncbi:MAG: TrmJ/YjtD family RNA methyltransferase, partial [Acidobacteriota bacterium]